MKKLAKKKTRNQYSKNLYFLFSYFISCAFLGWIFETIVIWILEKRLTARGFLFIGNSIGQYFHFLNHFFLFKNIPIIWGLPIIEIYGIGGCIIILLFRKLNNKPLLLFIIAMFSMTLFELISSYFCSYVLHHSYWDYSKEFMNFQGRICLRSSIAWGIIAVITIKILRSILELIYAEERRVANYKNVMRIVFIYTIICNIYKFVILK
jgi:uncharacterized membrane protein